MQVQVQVRGIGRVKRKEIVKVKVKVKSRSWSWQDQEEEEDSGRLCALCIDGGNPMTMMMLMTKVEDGKEVGPCWADFLFTLLMSSANYSPRHKFNSHYSGTAIQNQYSSPSSRCHYSRRSLRFRSSHRATFTGLHFSVHPPHS